MYSERTESINRSLLFHNFVYFSKFLILTHASNKKFSKIAKNLLKYQLSFTVSLCTDFNLESHNFSTMYFMMRWILWRDFKCPVQGHTSWGLGLNSVAELYMPNHDAVFFFVKFINSTMLLSSCALILETYPHTAIFFCFMKNFHFIPALKFMICS